MMYKKIKERFNKLFSKEEAEILNGVLEYADEKHAGALRASGEAFISHPIAVAEILMDLNMDCPTVAAGLLHDSIEDTPATGEELKARFGEEITGLVLGVTKFDSFKYNNKEDEAAENFLKMFFAMAKDIRVLIIKLADRLHNMQTIKAKERESQILKAKETLEIYAPLAGRLGLSLLKCELEDLCFETLKPDEYNSLKKELEQKRAESVENIEKVKKKLEEILKAHRIEGEVNGRSKHIYGVYKKMLKDQRTIDQIYDFTAVRVIVNTTAECFIVLGAIHSKEETDNWQPIPDRFKDYISVPKRNNYQSLHTTVVTRYGRGMTVEIQIRTHEMHQIAEYGIAAHWKYKENRTKSTELDNGLKWLRGIMDTTGGENQTPSKELYESIKLNFSGAEIFTFTPKGDVITLVEGSTPIDFAYAVHSEVGNRCAGCKVNHKIVPIETKLKTGDVVDILTSNNTRGPSRDWLRFVKTTQAISKIKAFFKKEMKDENIRLGKAMLEEEAKRRNYPLSKLMVQKWLDIIMQRLSVLNIDDLYASIGYGGISVNKVIPKLIEYYKKEEEQKVKAASKPSKILPVTQGVIVNGEANMLVRLAHCCSPVPGDDIVGFISRGRGIAVHRTNCPNLKSIEKYRLIKTEWAKDRDSAPFSVNLQLEAKNYEGLLNKITKEILELGLSLTALNSRIKNDLAIINFSVRVKQLSELEKLMTVLSASQGVTNVFRV